MVYIMNQIVVVDNLAIFNIRRVAGYRTALFISFICNSFKILNLTCEWTNQSIFGSDVASSILILKP